MRRQNGYSFVELLIVTAILFILASAVMPLAQVTSQRQREVELHRALREMRTAIDKFKDSVDQGQIPTTELEPNSGKCNAFSWGGERQWLHGPDKPGGRVFCYFDGNDAVAVWTHQRLGQPTHRDVLMIAREGGSDHAGLTSWWRPWHHLIGKAQ